MLNLAFEDSALELLGQVGKVVYRALSTLEASSWMLEVVLRWIFWSPSRNMWWCLLRMWGFSKFTLILGRYQMPTFSTGNANISLGIAKSLSGSRKKNSTNTNERTTSLGKWRDKGAPSLHQVTIQRSLWENATNTTVLHPGVSIGGDGGKIEEISLSIEPLGKLVRTRLPLVELSSINQLAGLLLLRGLVTPPL